jgi:hypothetical protein
MEWKLTWFEQAIPAVVQGRIREHPEQWLWVPPGVAVGTATASHRSSMNCAHRSPVELGKIFAVMKLSSTDDRRSGA